MPRNRVRYVPDHKGTGRLLTARQMDSGMVSSAKRGQRYAESISPRDSGEYASSFRTDSTRRGGPQRDRAEARLVNTSGHAMAVEYLTSGGYRVLGQTVDYIESRGP